MKLIRMSSLAAAIAIVAVASCSDSATSVLASLVSDSTLTADVAANAGDAMAVAVQTMLGNEGNVALPGIAQANMVSPENTLSFTRTSTCYNATGAVVANCTPLSSVRKIVSNVAVNGSRSGSSTTEGGVAKSWTGAVHRTSSDTLTRNFNAATPPVETSRTHSDVTVGSDTTTFTEGTASRKVTESTRDTVKAVTWNLPRSTNPWPASGSIVRAATIHATVTKDNKSESRDVARTVTITFPPDAQGNVVLKINDKTCNLNLGTHVVSNCH